MRGSKEDVTHRMPWDEEPAELEKARPGPAPTAASAREPGGAEKAAVAQVRASARPNPERSCQVHVPVHDSTQS